MLYVGENNGHADALSLEHSDYHTSAHKPFQLSQHAISAQSDTFKAVTFQQCLYTII